jgi:UDP-N-acetylmuramate--alanine ligase
MYKKKARIHFMGIGGIGMSGIAEILALQGYTVSGCDKGSNNTIISHLQSLGCVITSDHDALHTNQADVLVYSSAISQQHPEVLAALEKGIPVIPRAIMLAELMRSKYSVAVSGSHGKTTTTSLVSHIFIEAGLNPTVIIGGILKNIASNAQLGKGEVLIAEADESDRSLLYLNPTMAIVTNIDAEHLDTYADLDDIKQTFRNFLARLPFYGKAFVCIDDPKVQSILPLSHINTVSYGLSTKADVMGKIVELKKATSIFDVYISDKTDPIKKVKQGTINLNMPGKHNVLNALGAISLALEFDIPFKNIQQALITFGGIQRRFEFKGSYKGAEIFDDYGHHPTEIEQTLLVAQKRKQNKLHVVFQPHRFSRTEKLWDNFVETFSATHKDYHIDTLLMTDIYPASEDPLPKITTQRLIEAIKIKNPNLNITYKQTYEELAEYLLETIQPGDLVLTLGAGKVNRVSSLIPEFK